MQIAFRLFFIHIFAILAIWLSTYIVGLDVFLSLVYFVVISWEVYSLRGEPKQVKWLTALLWLGIPVILSFLTIFNLSNLSIFLLGFWFTPLLPILSIKIIIIANRPLYYYILIWLPFILALYFYLLISFAKK